MAKTIYYTSSPAGKNVYHNHDDCHEGKDIKAADKVKRVQCEVCAKKD
jgi:hypothetical protein